MGTVLRRLLRALGRIFPDCVTLGQAIAFNMFLAFFPILLLGLALLGATSHFSDALREIPYRLSQILPPSSSQVVSEYFVRKTVNPWRWFTLGLAGTLLAGTQVMVGYMEAFRVIEGDVVQLGYIRRQLRALLLLCLTIVPMLIVTMLTVFGKQTRGWLLLHTGSAFLTHELDIVGYIAFVFVLAMGVLVLIYRIGRPDCPGFRAVLPGALVATILWWAADGGFGIYVHRMPYDVVYRGLASAIGLLIWMFFTAMIVLLGAAYNAEAREEAAATKRVTKLIA